MAESERLVAAITTGLIHKTAMHEAGIPHPGHTELPADLTGAVRTCMMAPAKVVVSLVNICIRLAEVSRRLTVKRIVDTAELTVGALRRLGRRQASYIAAVGPLPPHTTFVPHVPRLRIDRV